MLGKFLLVGVGGSGGKTLRGVRKAIELKLEEAKWDGGIPEAWQFLHVDTPVSQDGEEFPAPFLPKEQYLSLVPAGVSYETIYNGITGKLPSDYLFDVEKPFPSPKEVTIPVEKGAGAFRAIGRTISAARLDEIQAKAKQAIGRLATASASSTLDSLARHLGIGGDSSGSPTVLIISSIAGGSGAGQFIDVAEAVKSASNNQEWAHHMISILYAPDVFEEIPNQGAIRANSLGAISELMSGIWNQNPSLATRELMKGQGLIVSSSSSYRIGPNYPYIVGRKNSQVDFGSQSGVYLAVSTSIAAMMTDSKLQDAFSAYTTANFLSKAPALTDNSRLRRPSLDSAPFSSLGFGRVALGLEKFFEYSGERLAKAALLNLLEKHSQQDPLHAEKTEAQWIQEYADRAYPAFLADSGLNELTTDNNQLLDAIRPDIEEIVIKQREAIDSACRGGMPKEGHNLNAWIDRIVNTYENTLGQLLGEIRLAREMKVREWAETIPIKTISLISQTAARQGLPVLEELLRRLSRQSVDAGAELAQERSLLLSEASSLPTLVAQAMQRTGMTAVKPNNPAVSEAFRQAEYALRRRAEADLRADAAEILSDYLSNFLEPLTKTIGGAKSSLLDRVNDPRLVDGRANPYSAWPGFEQADIPKKFRPAPNERLLVDPGSYPRLFDELVIKTVNEPRINAKAAVLEEFVMGKFGSEQVQKLKPENQWSLIEYGDYIWIPNNRGFQPREGAAQQARFKFLVDHMEYFSLAKKWLRIPGRAFDSFLDQSITDWLKGAGDSEVESKRLSTFIKEFDSAVASADPLVEINAKLLVDTHTDAAGKKQSLVSAIPVAQGTELFDALKDVLIKYGVWDEKTRQNFVGSTDGSKIKQIEVFSLSEYPVQPIVLGSVMSPIAQEWIASAGNRNSRSNFMQWRRGRSLGEAIPAAPSVWNQMLRGWYVAKLFSQVDDNRREPASEEKGPRLGIWIGDNKGFIDLPYPLMYPNIAPVPDYPGIIMESLSVAMVNCYVESSLEPLSPYHRLLKLGGSAGQADLELVDWINRGELREGAPTVKAERGGSPQDSPDTRRTACLEFFNRELSKFDEHMAKLSSNHNIRSFPVSWEIRLEIRRALEDLIVAVSVIEEEETV